MSGHAVATSYVHIYNRPWRSICGCGWYVEFKTKKAAIRHAQKHLADTDASSRADAPGDGEAG